MDLFSAVYLSSRMGIIKIYIFFYLSYWLRLLLIVCSDVESIQIQVNVLIGGYGSSILIFVVFMIIWTSWLYLVDRIMMFWFAQSLKSLIAAISQISISLALVAPNGGYGTPLLVPMLWLFMLGKDSAPSGRASWSVLAMNPVCFVFAVGKQFLCLSLLL